MDNQLASPAKASHERREQQRPPIPKAAPWLVFPHGKGREFQSFYNPCDPNNRNCIKSIPEMQGRAYYHKPSHQGWLIVIGNVGDNAEYSVAKSNLDDCFLWNPVSLETVQLPNLDRQSFVTKHKPEDYFLFDLVLSSPPPTPSTTTYGLDNLGCVVYLLFKHVNHFDILEDMHILAFCRPRDKQWITKVLSVNDPTDDYNPLSIKSLLFFGGKLYAFCKNSLEDGWVIQMDIHQQIRHQEQRLEDQLIKIIKLEHADFTWIGGGEQYSRYTEHWVESGNEIFKVHLHCSNRGFRKVASTHIFKLDFSSMTWILLKSLGDHVLFLSSNMDILDSRKCYSTSTACCSAADMGLERGCLFYTLLEDQTLFTFEPEDSATTVIMPCLQLPTPWFQPTWIMMPITEKRFYTLLKDQTLFTFEPEDSATTTLFTCLQLPTPWFLPSWIMMPTTKNRHLAGSRDTAETSVEEENMSRLNIGGGELEAIKQWDFLDDYDSTEEIARFLHPVDYIHFRLACKQNSIFLPALNRTSASTRTTTTTCLSPWLISIFEDNEDTICESVDPMHNNDKYLMKLSDQLLVGATIRFSKDGWLLLSNGKKTVFCYNPFTREIIRLPDLPDDYVLGGMSFSSVPTSRDCVVVAVSNWFDFAGYDEIFFLVTEPGKGATDWDVHDFNYEGRCQDYFMPCINNPVFYDRAFYCLDYNGMLGVFNMTGDSGWEILPKSLKQFSGFYPSYLVECDEKLLLVNLGQSGESVDVYRLDRKEMVWVKLNSLGKHALFISNASSFSAVAPRSCMENKIYFPRLYGERILYYSLDTCKYHYVGSNQPASQDFHNTKERLSCTWIEPRWS